VNWELPDYLKQQVGSFQEEPKYLYSASSCMPTGGAADKGEEIVAPMLARLCNL